jgi:hypothetical protein
LEAQVSSAFQDSEQDDLPAFADTPAASLAVGIALTIGAAAVGWVLAVPYLSPILVALLERFA